MNVLVVGSGGREHALVRSLVHSTSNPAVWCAPGNPGIAELASVVSLPVADHAAVASWCLNTGIDLVVVGPEAPLAEGLADDLRAAGIVVFGPSKAAARLESSKEFAKEFMERHSVPTAAYRSFGANREEDAIEWILSRPTPVVVKADGLAAGKGVTVAATHQEAVAAVKDAFSGAFGSAGARVVIEDFLHGEEASLFVVCDGAHYLTLVPAQDHKRAYDGDQGPNTGGMGAYAPAPVVTDEVLRRVAARIVEPTLAGMAAEGAPFTGCLFIGLMINSHGDPSVVEFNCRFGDPETEVVLPLIDGDVARLFYSAAVGHLEPQTVKINAHLSAATVVLASEGYPGTVAKGRLISGIEQAEEAGGIVFHAGTTATDDGLLTAGGRVLAVTALASTLAEAVEKAYVAVGKIHFDGMMKRSDIGAKGLARILSQGAE